MVFVSPLFTLPQWKAGPAGHKKLRSLGFICLRYHASPNQTNASWRGVMRTRASMAQGGQK